MSTFRHDEPRPEPKPAYQRCLPGHPHIVKIRKFCWFFAWICSNACVLPLCVSLIINSEAALQLQQRRRRRGCHRHPAAWGELSPAIVLVYERDPRLGKLLEHCRHAKPFEFMTFDRLLCDTCEATNRKDEIAAIVRFTAKVQVVWLHLRHLPNFPILHNVIYIIYNLLQTSTLTFLYKSLAAYSKFVLLATVMHTFAYLFSYTCELIKLIYHQSHVSKNYQIVSNISLWPGWGL